MRAYCPSYNEDALFSFPGGLRRMRSEEEGGGVRSRDEEGGRTERNRNILPPG
jgi:hypothetical protein